MNKEEFLKLLDNITPNKELNNDEAKFMMSLLFANDEGVNSDINEIDESSKMYGPFQSIMKEFIPQVFKLKLEKFTTLKIAVNSFWCLSAFMGSPGHATIYAYYLNHKLPKNTFIDIETLCQEVIPMGVFSDEQLNEIWEAQKVSNDDDMSEFTCAGAPDNKLDYLEFWQQ